MTERRRSVQEDYNRKHGIEPKSVRKEVRAIIEATIAAEEPGSYQVEDIVDRDEILGIIEGLETLMMEEAEKLNFEKAAELRDQIMELKKNLS